MGDARGLRPSRPSPPGGSTRLRESVSLPPSRLCWTDRSSSSAVGTGEQGRPCHSPFRAGLVPSHRPGAEDSCTTLSSSGQAARSEEA